MAPIAKQETSPGAESIISPLKPILVAGAGVIVLIIAHFANAREKDPSFVTVAGGWFDFNRKHDEGAEFRLEYRSNKKIWVFKPFVTSAVASNGMMFVGAGVLVDIYLGPNWVVTPSFAVTWWQAKTEGLDLGHPIEFRTQVELAYRFKSRARLGASVSHYSNASLAKKNPGTEALMLNYSSPIK